MPVVGVLGEGPQGVPGRPAPGGAGGEAAAGEWVTAAAAVMDWLEADMRALAAEYAERCGRWQAARDAFEAGTGPAVEVEFWEMMAGNTAHFRREREELRLLVADLIDRRLLRRLGDWRRTW